MEGAPGRGLMGEAYNARQISGYRTRRRESDGSEMVAELKCGTTT